AVGSAGARGKQVDARRRGLAGCSLSAAGRPDRRARRRRAERFQDSVPGLSQCRGRPGRYRRLAPQPGRRGAQCVPACAGRHAGPGRPAGRHLHHRGRRPTHCAGLAAAAEGQPGPAARLLPFPGIPWPQRRKPPGPLADGCRDRAGCRRARADRTPHCRHGATHRRALLDAVPPRDGVTVRMNARTPDFLTREHDPSDPSPWLALYLDRSTPLPDTVKEAWLADSSSASRQYLLPFLRPLARAFIILIQVAKTFLPRKWSHSKLLHRILAWGLEHFVSPEANWLILRHFHLGSQILAFIARNAPVPVTTTPLEPRCIADLKDEMFVRHDLNLFNFVINLNGAMRQAGTAMHAPAQ